MLRKKRKVKDVKDIRGVPVKSCIEFVWSIVRKMKYYSKYKYALDSEDLFQAGFAELLKSSKKFNKKRGTHLFTYLYLTVKGNAIIREIQKSYGIKVPAYLWDKYYKLVKQYRNDPRYFSRVSEHLNLEKLFNDGVINNSSKVGLNICEKLLNNSPFLIPWHKMENNSETCMKPMVGEFAKKIQNNPHKEMVLTEIESDFIRIIKGLPEISDLHKEIFIKSYGIGVEGLTPKELSKEYDMELNSIYRIRTSVRKGLIKDGAWLEDNFGKKMLEKLRNKELES